MRQPAVYLEEPVLAHVRDALSVRWDILQDALHFSEELVVADARTAFSQPIELLVERLRLGLVCVAGVLRGGFIILQWVGIQTLILVFTGLQLNDLVHRNGLSHV